MAWFVVLTMLSAGLLARHLVAMPAPSKTEQLGRQLRTLLPANSAPSWLAVHVLDSSCRCSERVALHLLDGARPDGWIEIILWVGDREPPRQLVERFTVRRVTPADLVRYGIEAAPLLVAVSPAGEVRYAGGYTDRKQGPVFHDLEVLRVARTSTPIESLPLFGCATSERLRSALANLPTP